MWTTTGQAVAALWALWIALNIILLLVSPYLIANASGPYTNGLKVVVPAGLAEKVSDAEMAALLAHEQGHVHHRHAAKNLLMACFFIPRSQALYRQQEIEADDYAAARAHAGALSSALFNLSFNDFDWQRAQRLHKIAQQGA